MTREITAENALDRAVHGMGGKTYKLNTRRGQPDRLVILPYRIIFFIEMKRPGKKAEAHQEREHAELRAMGHKVYVVEAATLERAVELMDRDVQLARLSRV